MWGVVVRVARVPETLCALLSGGDRRCDRCSVAQTSSHPAFLVSAHTSLPCTQDGRNWTLPCHVCEGFHSIEPVRTRSSNTTHHSQRLYHGHLSRCMQAPLIGTSASRFVPSPHFRCLKNRLAISLSLGPAFRTIDPDPQTTPKFHSILLSLPQVLAALHNYKVVASLNS